jgi:hypothetical protein
MQRLRQKNKLAKGRERDTSKTKICQGVQELLKHKTSFGITADKSVFMSLEEEEGGTEKNVATPGRPVVL